MEEKSKKAFPLWELCFPIAVTIAFIALIWRFIPIQETLKLSLICVGGVGILAAVIFFVERLPFFIPTPTRGTNAVIVLMIFLLFPAMINALYESSKNTYLSDITPDTLIGLKITYDVERTGGSGSIGSDWKYLHFYNDTKIGSGSVVDVRASDTFTIRSRFIEVDDAISDVGETISKPISYYKMEPANGELVIKNDVLVAENGGRRYAGSYAEFTATYRVKLTMPKSMGFWSVYFSTEDTSIRWILVLSQLCCLAIIAYVIAFGAKREEQAKEQARMAQEKERQAKREEFIQKLDGRTIRELAGVPPNIHYENGLPRDNNNRKYGSFTVYTTKSGSCYHETPGCCSARFPIHVFVAMGKYKPCSKCCMTKYSIPEWHTKYVALVKQCKEYSVEYE